MEICDLPDPRIENDTDVLIKVGAVGVCGSDVHYYLTGRIGSQVVEYPYRVGHEFAGTVEEVADGVSGLKVGDRVAVDPAMSCGECDQCRAGRLHTCRRLLFLGCPGQADGCLSEYVVMPQECCLPVGPSTTLETAALIEPLSIGLYAVRLAGLREGGSIGVLGSGPIGLSVLLAAGAEGDQQAYVTDKINSRTDMAAAAGAIWTGNPDQTDIVADICEQADGGLDVVFECCGEQDALDQSVNLLNPGGTLMLIGIPTVDRISFPIDLLRRKEIRIQNVRRQNECMQPTLDLIESGRLNPDFMITHHFNLEQAKQAFDLVAEYADGVMKAMITV